MTEASKKRRDQLERQAQHWIAAVDRLDGWESWASTDAWRSLEQYLGLTLRQTFVRSIAQLRHDAVGLMRLVKEPDSEQGLARLQGRMLRFRRQFVRVETMLDFFGDAVNTRTSEKVAALLRACDRLAQMSMKQMLEQFGERTAPVLTYIDKGMGASILKAGLRLWDGVTVNPVATIKIVRHNLLRPTSLIHEAGHQVAHQLHWSKELATVLAKQLGGARLELVETWSGWSSEIAGDIFAFVHTGYASVVALHDVLAGEEDSVFALRPFDPHPVSFIRVLLGVELCRHSYGKGPWDDLADAWRAAHPLERAPGEARELLAQSLPHLPGIARACLRRPMKAFGGKAIVECIDPRRVDPGALADLERKGGAALYSSTQWANTEGLRITALTGLRSAQRPQDATKYWKKQEEMMLVLGGTPAQLLRKSA